MGDDGGENRGGSDLEARLKRLSQDLGVNPSRTVSSAPDTGTTADDAMAQARSAGFRVLGEFVAAIVAGVLIGYFIDRFAGTSPVFLIIFLVLGAAAGFLNIVRAGSTRRTDNETKPHG